MFRSHDIEWSHFYQAQAQNFVACNTSPTHFLTSWPFWNSVNIMMCFLSPLGIGSYMMVFLGVPLLLLFQVAIANYLHHPQLMDWSCHPASWPSSWGFHKPWVWYHGILDFFFFFFLHFLLWINQFITFITSNKWVCKI